jgi:hypothetical protein
MVWAKFLVDFFQAHLVTLIKSPMKATTSKQNRICEFLMQRRCRILSFFAALGLSQGSRLGRKFRTFV